MRSILLTLAICVASTAIAGEQPAQLTQSYAFTPKAGQAQQFEDAVRAFFQWAKEHGETWDWSAHRIITGEKFGTYLFISHGHTWADFDDAAKYRREASKYWDENVAPYVASKETRIFRFLPELSYLPDSQVLEERNFSAVAEIHLKPFAATPFLAEIGKFVDVMKNQESAQPLMTFVLVDGGDDQIVFAHPQVKWSGVEGVYKSLQDTIDKMGPEAEELGRKLSELTKRRGRSTLAHRADLSFKADGAGDKLTNR